ncbi:peroxisome biogenesis protein 22-like [Curcuma longa]|uniref:peroxisome biogenesis protein 22-like n=1 Tax=Curcuma longa TaxID=136217 RepID=UPI003D9E0BC8
MRGFSSENQEEMVAPQSMMGSVSQSPDPDKGDELRDLMQRFMASLAEFSQRLPFDVDFQKLRSITTLATLAVTLIFAWKLWRTIPDQQLRQRRRPATSPIFSTNNLHPDTSLRASDIRSYSGDSRAQRSVNEFIQPLELSLEQLVRHRLNDGRKVTCQLLGVVLDETTPEELQTRATVRSSVLEVLLQINKFCDVYLMERILDDESGERVLSALEDSGVFTSGGLVRDKVLFCSTENGRISFVRQLEPDWHIDANSEIVHQLTRFIKYLLHVTPDRPQQTAPNVFISTSLEQFFGDQGRK